MLNYSHMQTERIRNKGLSVIIKTGLLSYVVEVMKHLSHYLRKYSIINILE